jgi:hypothetical protein
MPPATFELLSEGFMSMSDINRWTLVGGTALAIHYQHRLSEDLDLFVRNSTLEQDRKRIGKMMDTLEQAGFEVAKLQENDTQIDFEIHGVKVTFFASSLDILQRGSLSFGQVSVAGIDTIKAMKMDAILNHRTLSRDFFDIATIMKHEKLTLFEMLDSYRQHYTKKLSPTLILERLTQRAFDPDDPGLTQMKPRGSIDAVAFRQDLAAQIKAQSLQDSQSIHAIISSPPMITRHLERKFGLSRMNLPQKLATLGEDDLVLTALEAGDFDIACKDMIGHTLLDHYLENDAMFAKILGFAKTIPDGWLQNRTFKRHSKDRLIALENSIVSCAENKHNSQEKIERIAARHSIEVNELLERVEAKEKLLNSISKV